MREACRSFHPTYPWEAPLSRVCVDLPGNGDMCHRLVEYLAIGCCVVRPAPKTRLHVPLADGINTKYGRDDPSDLVGTCANLSSDPTKSARIGIAAREYYDRFLRTDQLAGYYVDRCASILSWRDSG